MARRKRDGLCVRTLPLLRDDLTDATLPPPRQRDFLTNLVLEHSPNQTLPTGWLDGSDLWWITEPMCALVHAAAPTLPDTTIEHDWAPSPNGLLIWETSLGLSVQHTYSWSNGYEHIENRLVRGAVWNTDIDGLHIKLLVTDPIAALGVVIHNPPLDGSSQDRREIAIQQLVTTWILADQPTVSARTFEHSPLRRSWVPKPDTLTTITVATLRRITTTTPPTRTTTTDEDDGRRPGPNIRFLVRGHWRNQACGPKHTKRRPTWIAPFIKGPDTAPFRQTNLVKVWKR